MGPSIRYRSPTGISTTTHKFLDLPSVGQSWDKLKESKISHVDILCSSSPFWLVMLTMTCHPARISLSNFTRLSFLHIEVDGTDWQDVADMLQPLPARLVILLNDVFYNGSVSMINDAQLVKEDGELKAMSTNGLEVLDPVLSRDNFKDLRHLTFELSGYRDTLPSYQESTLEAIQRKLPTLHSRATLDIQLGLILFDRSPLPSPVSEGNESMQSDA